MLQQRIAPDTKNVIDQARQNLAEGNIDSFVFIIEANFSNDQIMHEMRGLIREAAIILNPMQYSGINGGRTNCRRCELNAFHELAVFVYDNKYFLNSFIAGTREYLTALAADSQNSAFYTVFRDADPNADKTGTVTRGEKVNFLASFVTPQMVRTYFGVDNALRGEPIKAQFVGSIVERIVKTRPDLVSGLPNRIFALLARDYTKRLDYGSIQNLATPVGPGGLPQYQAGGPPILSELKTGIAAGMVSMSKYGRREMRRNLVRNKVLWGKFRGDKQLNS